MKRKVYGFAAIIIILAVIFIASIQPVKKFNKDDSSDKVSLKQIFQKELLDSLSSKLLNNTKDFSFHFSEEDMNNIIAEKSDKVSNPKFSGIHCAINNGEVVFYIDTKLVSVIPTQLVVKTNLDVIDNEVNVTVKKAYIGRLPVPKSQILKMLKGKKDSYSIDTSNSIIKIPVYLPGAIGIKDFKVTDKLSFNIRVSIQSMNDLVELFGYFGKKM